MKRERFERKKSYKKSGGIFMNDKPWKNAKKKQKLNKGEK